MSDEIKKIVKEISETFKKMNRDADNAAKKANLFDKNLGDKIKKASEKTQEVIRHIDERIGK